MRRGFVCIADFLHWSRASALVTLDFGELIAAPWRATALPAPVAEDLDLLQRGPIINRPEGGRQLQLGLHRRGQLPISLYCDGMTFYCGAMNGGDRYQVPARLQREGATTRPSPPPSAGRRTRAGLGRGRHRCRWQFTTFHRPAFQNAISGLSQNGKLADLVSRSLRLQWPGRPGFQRA